MFTVKSVINGVTNIREQSSVVIAHAGSDRFDEILTQTNSHSNPDFVLWLPAVYEDEKCTIALQEEELIFSEREGVTDKDALAVIIDDYESPNAEFNGHADGLHYQFIYPGDKIFVMNSHGSTIETVK